MPNRAGVSDIWVPGCQAARRAGYAEGVAKERASTLMGNPKILAAIASYKIAKMQELEVDPSLPLRVFVEEAEGEEYSRDRLRRAEPVARWMGQVRPDTAIQNDVGFLHQQADISLEHLRSGSL